MQHTHRLNNFSWQPTLFQSLQPDFNILVALSSEDIKQGHELNLTYLNVNVVPRSTKNTNDETEN